MTKLKKILFIITVLLIVVVVIYNIPENIEEFKTEHFTFLYNNNVDSDDIMVLSKALEDNYSRIGNNLKTAPADNIEINIYAHRWRYIAATRNWGGSGNIEGISKIHFLTQAWGEPDAKKVAVHEFAHTVTLKLLIENEPQPLDSKEFDRKFSTFPVWLWEGISVYEAKQFVDPKTLIYLKNGHFPDIEELNSRLKGGKIYSCGYTIIEYILFKYGQEKLIRLIKNYGDLNSTFEVNEDNFCKGWYEFVKAKYLQ